MTAIYKRELRALFTKTRTLTVLALYLLCVGVLFVTNNLATGYSEAYALLSMLTPVAAVLIPIAVTWSVCRDRGNTAAVQLLALPLTSFGVVSAKLLALLTFFMIPTAVVAAVPFYLGLLGASSVGVAYPAILMFVLFELFIITLSFLCALLVHREWKAWLAIYLTLGALFALGVLAVILPEMLEGVVQAVSPFKQYDSAVFGLFDLGSLLFYLSFSVIFALISAALLRQRLMPRIKRAARRARKIRRASVCISAVCLCLCVNILFALLPSRARHFDVSASRLYTVSDDTQKYLDSLEEDITVYLINPSGEEMLGRYIERYCELSERVKLMKIFTYDEPDFLSSYGYTADSVARYSMIVQSEHRWKFVSAESLFSFYHEDYGYMSPSEYTQTYSYYTQLLSAGNTSVSEEGLNSLAYDTRRCITAEQAISEAIEYVLAEYIPTIYFISGHGEKNTQANPLNLSQSSELPRDAALLIINSPSEDYTLEEIQRLKEFTDKGGHLTVLTNKQAEGHKNLLSLFACYGICINTEGNLSESVSAVPNNSETAVAALQINSLTLNGATALTASEADDVSVAPLLTSTVKVADDTADGESVEKTYSVAMISYKGDEARFAWFSGADSFNVSADDLKTDGELDEEKYTNYTKVMSMLSAITSSLRGTHATTLTFPTPRVYAPSVLVLDEGDATLGGVLFIVVIPGAIIAALAIKRYIRRKRGRAAA